MDIPTKDLIAEDRQKLYQQRTDRFHALLDEVGAEGPDSTVPGSSSSSEPGRFAVLTDNNIRGGRSLDFADDLAAASKVGAANIDQGWVPLAYFDLDDIDGEEPPPREGDLVEYDGDEFYVVHASDELVEGAIHWLLWLDEEESKAAGPIDAAQHAEISQHDVTIVEREEPDHRLPKRYDVARVEAIVVFNTVPTES
jgi:hypothetical protein